MKYVVVPRDGYGGFCGIEFQIEIIEPGHRPREGRRKKEIVVVKDKPDEECYEYSDPETFSRSGFGRGSVT